jgi:hypothetical protein
MSSTVLQPDGPDAPLRHDDPLIDIDHTVWIQLLLFVLVAFVSTRLLFRPYLKVRDARTAGIEGARDEAARRQRRTPASPATRARSMPRGSAPRTSGARSGSRRPIASAR